MTAYNLVNPSSLVAGQPEDVSQVLANFQAIQNVLNGNIDDGNIKAAAGINPSKLLAYPNDPSKLLRGDGAWNAQLTGAAVGSTLFASRVAGDTQDRWHSRADGQLEWGPGNAAIDTSLYRSAAGELTTGGTLRAGSAIFSRTGDVNKQIALGDDGTNASIFLGTALDTKLYRSAAGTLKTDGVLIAGSYIESDSAFVVKAAGANNWAYQGLIGAEAQPRLIFQGDGKMLWGLGGSTAVDTNLYRVGPGMLKMDGSNTGGITFVNNAYYNCRVFAAAGDSQPTFQQYGPTGGMEWGPGGSTATDTKLSRSGVGVLKTDGNFLVGGQLWLQSAIAGAVGGTLAPYRFPIYNQAGTILGYVPVYTS